MILRMPVWRKEEIAGLVPAESGRTARQAMQHIIGGRDLEIRIPRIGPCNETLGAVGGNFGVENKRRRKHKAGDEFLHVVLSPLVAPIMPAYAKGSRMASFDWQVQSDDQSSNWRALPYDRSWRSPALIRFDGASAACPTGRPRVKGRSESVSCLSG